MKKRIISEVFLIWKINLSMLVLCLSITLLLPACHWLEPSDTEENRPDVESQSDTVVVELSRTRMGDTIISWQSNPDVIYHLYWSNESPPSIGSENKIENVISPFVLPSNPNDFQKYLLVAVIDNVERDISGVFDVSFPPSAPQNIIATSENGNIALHWESVPRARRYHVYEATTSAFNFDTAVLLDTVNTSRYVHQNLAVESTHHYWIVALGEDGISSAPSIIISAKVVSTAMPISNFTVSVDKRVFKINWSPVIEGAQYDLYISRSPNPFAKQQRVYKKVKNDQPIIGLDTDTPFYFQLLATKDDSQNVSEEQESQITMPMQLVTSEYGGYSCAIKGNGTLWCWGGNYWGQLSNRGTQHQSRPSLIKTHQNAETADNDWLKVALDNNFACGIKINGDLWCWGNIGYLTLESNTTESQSNPTLINVPSSNPSSEIGWRDVVILGRQVCGLKRNGMLWCWNINTSFSPKLISTTSTVQDADWTKIVFDKNYNFLNCALKVNHTLWCWKKNKNPISMSIDPQATLPDTDWFDVSLHSNRVCGLKFDGSVWCWQGIDSIESNVGPKAINAKSSAIEPETDWAKNGDICYIKLDGTLWCWRRNIHSVIPDEDENQEEIIFPESISVDPLATIPDSDWVHVKFGEGHSCGLKIDGSLWCWGRNYSGGLGNGSAKGSIHPVLVQLPPDIPASETAWVDIQLGTDGFGSDYSCALKANDTLWCWGTNSFGQVGNGSARSANESMYQVPVSIGTGWDKVTFSGNHTCGIKQEGSLWCWGVNGYGNLGDGTTESRSRPISVSVDADAIQPDMDWQDIVIGNVGLNLGMPDTLHSCGLKQNGTMWCWGYNLDGRLGIGNNTHQVTPISVSVDPNAEFPDSDWATIAINISHLHNSHTCATKTNGTLWCWGYSADGQLGDGILENRNHPIAVNIDLDTAIPESDWNTVVSGDTYSCATKKNGTLWCWGHAQDTIEGSGFMLSDKLTPVALTTNPDSEIPDNDWTTMVLAQDRGCALKDSGTLWCWGSNNFGRLGTGNKARSVGPAVVSVDPDTVIPDNDWASIALDHDYSCGLKTNGTLWCWGGGDLNRSISNDPLVDTSRPVLITVGATPLQPDTDWVAVAGNKGLTGICGLKWNGTLWCINADRHSDQRFIPISSDNPLTTGEPDSDWKTLSSGMQNCAIKTDSTLWCWGLNNFGQLGDGTGFYTVPQRVEFKY